MKTLLIAMLTIVLFCLARASYHLVSKQKDGKKMAQTLTWRISLSLITFGLLFIGLAMGWIHPHGLVSS